MIADFIAIIGTADHRARRRGPLMALSAHAIDEIRALPRALPRDQERGDGPRSTSRRRRSVT